MKLEINGIVSLTLAFSHNSCLLALMRFINEKSSLLQHIRWSSVCKHTSTHMLKCPSYCRYFSQELEQILVRRFRAQGIQLKSPHVIPPFCQIWVWCLCWIMKTAVVEEEDQTVTRWLQLQAFSGPQPSPTSTQSLTPTAHLTPSTSCQPGEEEEEEEVSTVKVTQVFSLCFSMLIRTSCTPACLIQTYSIPL